VSNDHNGLVDDPWNGRPKANKQNANPIEEQNDAKHSKPKEIGSLDEHKVNTKAEILDYANSLPEDQKDEFLGQLALVQEWSAILPDPDSYNKYPEEAQRKMIEWNDAQILDESRRNDKLVDCFVKNQNRNQILSFAINFGFLLASFISFLITRDPASFGFLSVPGITIAVNLWKDREKKKIETIMIITINKRPDGRFYYGHFMVRVRNSGSAVSLGW
jgi:hypothetical protein